MIELSQVASELKDIDATMNRWLGRDVIDDCNDRSNEAIDAWNEWVRQSSADLEAPRKELDGLSDALNAGAAAIDASRTRLAEQRSTSRDAASLDQHHRQVDEHNATVRRHAADVDAYNARQTDYSRRLADYATERVRRETELNEILASVRKESDEYTAWMKREGKEQFFRRVNLLYGGLLQRVKEGGPDVVSFRAYLGQVRLVRQQLATDAQREQEAKNGVLIVPALLMDEECYFMVAPDSTMVSVSPEIVQALGLTDTLREEIEISIAGGLTARGRKLALASLSVQEMEEQNVEAVQLVESHCGVDGVLGLSFLNRFDYVVEREKPQRLTLNPKVDTSFPYDVFISHKSEDEWWAHVVFDALNVMRYRPFLSGVSLRHMQEDMFQDAIVKAVSGSRHLVVVGSSTDNMNSPWVRDEWNLFRRLKLSQDRQGRIVPIVCGTMKTTDLPHALSGYQAIMIREQDFRQQLRNFLSMP